MGGAASSRSTLPTEDHSGRSIPEDVLVKVVMPIYYTTERITEHEQEKAVKSWKSIAGGQAAEFYRLKKADPVKVTSQTPMEFFGHQLVARFIEVHPVVKHMFSKNVVKQGSLFFRMIAFTIAALDDDSKFDSQFVTLARTHNRMGIRAVEYGIFGECLFWVLRLTLGPEVYDTTTHLGWVKIYSRILGVVIPIALRYELDNNSQLTEKASQRVRNMSSSLSVASEDGSSMHSSNLSMSGDKSVASEGKDVSDSSVHRFMAVVPH